MLTVDDTQAMQIGDARFDRQPDPTSRISGMPPNMGNPMMPHVATFTGIYGTQSRVYRASDEAIKHSFDNARFMRNDVTIMECLEMRSRAVALVDWSIEPEDTNNREHVALCDYLTKVLEEIPRFMQYQENLLHATFFGRYASQNVWGKQLIDHRMATLPVEWMPVHGDKLVFRYDDGMNNYRPNQIGIRVGPAALSKRLAEHQLAKIETTDSGLAYFLDTWERPLLSVHKYRVEDGEFEAPENAGRIHGTGIRSVIYWTWYQKQETLAYLMEYLERSAAGFEIWYYPMGNAEAEAKTRTAAQERIGNGRNIILVPKPQGDDAAYYDVQRIEPGMAGADALKSIITDYFGHSIKRYILGQTLTTEASSTGLGSNLADIHMDTFMQIVRYDSMILEESIDKELLKPIIAFTCPRYSNVRVHFRKHLTEPDAETTIKALQIAFDMGLKIDAQKLRDLIGAAKPEADAEVLDKMAQMKAEAEAQQPPGGMPGMPGMPGAGMPPGGAPEGEPPQAKPTAQAQPVEQAEYQATPPGDRGDREKVEMYRRRRRWRRELARA